MRKSIRWLKPATELMSSFYYWSQKTYVPQKCWQNEDTRSPCLPQRVQSLNFSVAGIHPVKIPSNHGFVVQLSSLVPNASRRFSYYLNGPVKLYRWILHICNILITVPIDTCAKDQQINFRNVHRHHESTLQIDLSADRRSNGD